MPIYNHDMKKLSYLVLMIMCAFAACKKGAPKDDGLQICWIEPPIDTANIADGCISKYSTPVNSRLTAANLAIATQLFNQNSLSTSNLSFTDISSSTNYLNQSLQSIRADQLYKGLPLFYSDIIFHFTAGAYTSTSGTQFTNLSPDTVPATKLQPLYKLFKAQLNHDAMLGFTGKSYKDSCMKAEFGYYDLHNQVSSLPVGSFVKAWKVTPVIHDYPVAFFRDDQLNGLIYYFNGIIIN